MYPPLFVLGGCARISSLVGRAHSRWWVVGVIAVLLLVLVVAAVDVSKVAVLVEVVEDKQPSFYAWLTFFKRYIKDIRSEDRDALIEKPQSDSQE